MAIERQPMRGPALQPGPFVAGGFAAVAAIGTTQPWARILFVTLNGTEADRGLICFVASLIAVALCVGRAFFSIHDLWYFGVGMILAAVVMGMPIWFLVDIERARSNPDDKIFSSTVITASFPLYLTIGAGFGYALALVWQLLPSRAAAR